MTVLINMSGDFNNVSGFFQESKLHDVVQKDGSPELDLSLVHYTCPPCQAPVVWWSACVIISCM